MLFLTVQMLFPRGCVLLGDDWDHLKSYVVFIKTKLETLSSFPQLPLAAEHCLQLQDALVAIVSLCILRLLAHRQCDTYSSPSGLGRYRLHRLESE